jgi:hypothetical protein
MAVIGPGVFRVELTVKEPVRSCVGSVGTSAQSLKCRVEAVTSRAWTLRSTVTLVTQ